MDIATECLPGTIKMLDTLVNNPTAEFHETLRVAKVFAPHQGGRPGIPLRVVAVNHEVYDPYITSHKAKPFGPDEVPQVFGSVSSLAKHLGIHAPNMNYLMMQLRAEQDPKEEVTVRGVTFKLDFYRD